MHMVGRWGLVWSLATGLGQAWLGSGPRPIAHAAAGVEGKWMVVGEGQTWEWATRVRVVLSERHVRTCTECRKGRRDPSGTTAWEERYGQSMCILRGMHGWEHGGRGGYAADHQGQASPYSPPVRSLRHW